MGSMDIFDAQIVLCFSTEYLDLVLKHATVEKDTTLLAGIIRLAQVRIVMIAAQL